MTAADRERWDAKYAGRELPDVLTPSAWLIEQAADLPPGKALDLACGGGHAAIWLAQRGWDVTAIDVSPVGLELAQQLANREGVSVNWQLADLDDIPLGEADYQLITVFRFLDRKTLPARITAALQPGGRLLYETFVAGDQTMSSPPLRNPAFLLRPGELPQLFSALTPLAYAEVRCGADHLARFAACR